MKSIFLVGEKKLELKTVADPVPSDDGLVLQVKACGVCGSDLRRWKAGPPDGRQDVVPGHEVAGIVVETGKNMKEFPVGTRLAIGPDVHCGRCYYCRRGLYNLCDHLILVGITPGYPGGFAEKMAISHDILYNGICHVMPDTLSFFHAALSEPCCSVLATHIKAGTGLGDTVVVMGAGPAGCIHIAVAKARGARVIVSEPSENRRQMAEKMQPDAIVIPDGDNLADMVREMTHGIGADIVVCANPVAATHTEAVDIVRKAGRVVLYGGLPKTNPQTVFDGNKVHYGEIEVVGAFSYHPSMHELALDLLARGVIPADKIITHSFPLQETQRAYEAAAGGHELKVVVTA